MIKKILIISYTFPPTSGVGGRRWAKFAKYIYREGVDVHVIAAKSVGKEESTWKNDVTDLVDKVERIDFGYPNILSKHRLTSFMDKIFYKLFLLRVKLGAKGNYYDRSIFVGEKLKLAISKKIQSGFNHIIVTGAPFKMMHDVVSLKKDYPDIHVTADFRDPWTWGDGYGFKQLSKERAAYEMKLEADVLQQANLITVPVMPMYDHLKEKYSFLDESQLLHLPHGFDEDDIQQKWTPVTNTKIIYAGTLYADLEPYFKKLNDEMLQIPNEKRPVIDFFPMNPEKFLYYKSLCIDSELDGNFVLNEVLPPHALFNKMQDYAFFLTICPERFKDFISSKYYELFNFGIPILYIGAKGLLSKTILENDAGNVFDVQEFSFDKIDMSRVESSVMKEYSSKYSIWNLTKNLISNIEKT